MIRFEKKISFVEAPFLFASVEYSGALMICPPTAGHMTF
jgi:hypothetical protein